MNKIYKVIWNVCRAGHVVTNEKTKTHGKESSSVLHTIEVLAIEASLLTLPLTAVAQAINHALEIDQNWLNDQTKVVSTQNNLHHKVTTNHIVGSVAANRFTKFNVGEKHLVDLHLPANTNHLVNFVDAKIEVGGTVNSIKESQIGGNLYFVSPQGLVVGQKGVINAGSLTTAITSQKEYEKLSKLSDKNMPLGLGQTEDEALKTLDKLQKGEVPLNPSGVITVKGKINVGNKITLAASKIGIEDGAHLSNLESDLKDIVHIKEGDQFVTKSEVQNALVVQEDGNGDILLLARSDSSEVSSAAGSFTKPKVSAKVEVKKNASVKSRGSIKVAAAAGNGTYDVEKKLRPVGYDSLSDAKKLESDRETGRFLPDGQQKMLEVEAVVNIGGSLLAKENLVVDALAENHFTKSLSSAVDAVTLPSLEILGTATAFNEAAYYADLKTVSLVNVEKDAVLESLKDLTVNSEANTKIKAGTSTSIINLFNADTTQKVPATATVVVLADSASSVSISGLLKAEGDLSLQSADLLTAEANAIAATKNSQAVEVALQVAKLKGTSVIDVAETAVLDLKGGISNLVVASNQQTSVKTKSEVVVQDGSYGGLAFNYTELDTASHLNLLTGLKNPAASILVSSNNITEDLTITADNAVGASGISKLLFNTIGAVSRDFVAGLMGQVGKGVDNKFDSTVFKLGGAAAAVLGSQDSSVLIKTPVIADKSQGLVSAGDIQILSESLLRDHHYLVTSKVSSSAPDGEASKTKFQGSVAVLAALPKGDKDSVSSILTIADHSVISSSNGQAVLDSSAEVEWNRVLKMKEDYFKARDQLKALFANKFKEQWNKKVAPAFEKVDEDFEKVESSNLSALEKIKQVGASFGTLGSALGEFFKEAALIAEIGGDTGSVIMSLLEFIKPTNYLNAYAAAAGDASSDQSVWSAAGTALVINQKTASNLNIGKNAQLNARFESSLSADGDKGSNSGNLIVRSNALNESLVLGGHTGTVFGIPIPDIEKASVVGATVLYNQLSSLSRLTIREGAVLNADKTALITSQDSIYALTIGASADVNKGTLGLEGLAAVAVTKGTNLLWLDDEAQINAGSIELSAKRDDDIQTIAGAVVVSLSDDANKSAGAGIAVNTGSLDNELRISDNDILGQDDTSLIDRQGHLKATGKNDTIGKIDLIADEDLTMNAIGVAGALGVSGHSPDSGEPPGKISQFFSKIGDKVSHVSEGFSFYLEEGGPLLANKANELGAAVRDKFNKTQSQNDPTSSSMNNNNNSNLAQNGSTAGTTDSSTSGVANGGTNQFQLGAAGSAAWNNTNTANKINVLVGNFLIEAPEELSVDAVTDKWVGAWAGAAGVTYTQTVNAADYSAGIAGSVAGNTGIYKTNVYIDGTRNGGQGLALGLDLKKINVRSVSDGNLVAEGLAAAVSTGATKFAGALDAGVSVNLVKTEVTTDVKGLFQSSPELSTMEYNQASWAGDNQVTGGIGFSFGNGGAQGAKSFAGSLVFAVADIDNNITSALTESILTLSGSSAVRALSDITQVTTAVSSSVSTGQSSFALSGAASSSELKNTVSVHLNNLNIKVKGGSASFEGAARSSAGSENKEFENLSKSNKYVDNLDELTNDKYFRQVELQLQPTEEEKGKESSSNGSAEKQPKKQNLGELAETSGKMKQITVTVSPGISTNGSSAGAAVAVNQINNNFGVTVGSSTINFEKETSSLHLDAKDDVLSLAVAAGAAGGKGKFNAAGSVIVSNTNQTSVTDVNDLKSNTNSLSIAAENAALNINVAGNVGVNVGDGAIGAVGASVIVANTNNKADAKASNLDIASILQKDSVLNIRGANTAASWAAAVDGMVSGSGTVSIGGAVAVNRIKNDALASLTTSHLQDIQRAAVSASDHSETWTLAGNVAVAAKGQAGISGAVAYASSRKSSTNAQVSGLVIANRSEANLTDLTIEGTADDRLSTLVLSAGVAQGKVGLAGAAGTNEIERSVNASGHNIQTVRTKDIDGLVSEENAVSIGAAQIRASNNSGIGNVDIVGAVGAQGVGIGLGVAVNRITSTVSAGLSADSLDAGFLSAKTLSVIADSNNDIDTVGIGGAGGSYAGIAASTAVNLIKNDTSASVNSAKAEYSGAAVIQAKSDDTIGTYGGQIEGAKNAAVGATVTVSEKTGSAKVSVQGSEIKQAQNSSSDTLTVKEGVTDADINNKIVNEVSTAVSLRDKRKDKIVSGLLVDASSTQTLKTFYITGGGAKDAAITATGNVNYLGGKTSVLVDHSILDAGAKNLDIHASDASNIDTVIVAAQGAVGAAVGIITNVITTDRTTQLEVTGTHSSKSILTGNQIDLSAQSKEGISSLAIAASGAVYAAVSGVVNVNRQLSGAAATVQNANMYGGYKQAASYLGRITTSGIAAAGSQYAAVPVNVVVNYASNDVSSLLRNSAVSADNKIAEIYAGRISELSSVNVTAAGAMYGAVSALVNVNTVEGQTSVEADSAKINAGEFRILAENEDHLKVADVTAAGAIGGVGASVVVSYLKGNASAVLRNSTVTAPLLKISSLQDHFVNGTVALAAGGIGSLGANVFSLVIGSSDNPFAENKQDLAKTEETVNDYLSKYASSGAGALGFINESSSLSAEEKNRVIAGAASQNAAVSSKTCGTSVVVSGNDVNAVQSEISAKEDSKENQKIDVTLGSGEAGVGVLAASVATLRRHYNSQVNIAGNLFKNVDRLDVANILSGHSNLTAIQTSVALASGTAAYVDAKLTGGASTVWESSEVQGKKKEGGNEITGQVNLLTGNDSETKAYAFGINVAAVSGGGMVSNIKDHSQLSSTITDSVLSSNFASSVMRAQKLTAEAKAGYGGAVNGVGALATVLDGRDGQSSVKTVFDNNRVGAVSVNLLTNNRPDIFVKGYSAGAAGFGIGVVKATAESRGQVLSSASNNTFTGSSFTVLAGAGLTDSQDPSNEEQALKMKALSESYGGAIIASIPVNSSSLLNANKVSSIINLSKEGSLAWFEANAEGNAVYDSRTTAGSGGIIASGNNEADVKHQVSVTETVVSGSSTAIGEAEVLTNNREKAVILATSAGGGVILGEGTTVSSNAAQVSHKDTSSSQLNVSGTWNISKSASFGVSGNHDIGMTADNTKGALAGGSGAGLVNEMQGANRLSVEDSSILNASYLSLSAFDGWNVHSAVGNYAVDSKVYGAFVGTGIEAINTEKRTQEVTVGKNARLSAHDLALSSSNNGITHIKVRARSAGAASGVTAKNTQTIDTQNLLNIGSGALLTASNTVGTLILSTSSDEDLHIESIGDVEGAAVGGAGATIKVMQNRLNQVNLAASSRILSKGKVAVRAGRDLSGDNAKFNLAAYSHAYSHSAIGGTDSVVNDKLNLNNQLFLNGNITSWRDIELYAKEGDVSTEETARYWFWTTASDAGEVSIASTKAGTKSKNLTTINQLDVKGQVQAGVNTRADVVIEGIVSTDQDNKEQVQDGKPAPTITQSGADEAVIKFGTEELANIYWERHLQLQTAMRDYATTSPSMLAAYLAEDNLLIETMKQKGLVVMNSSNKPVLVKSVQRPFVEISNLTVSGGNISVFADSVIGSGSLIAKSAEGIFIDNRSTSALKLSDLQILDQGGTFKLNDQVVTDKTGGMSGFAGNFVNSANSNLPEINIKSKFNGTVTLNTAEGSKTLTPDTGIDISGNLVNRVGNIVVESGGDIYSDPSAHISAGGSLAIKAAGSITQSYHEGLFNVGGAVEDLWKTEAEKLTDTNSSVTSNENKVYQPGQHGDMVAGGSIFLAADAVNLNGYVQSGYSAYELVLSEDQLNKKIEAIKSAWKADGSKENINVRSAKFLLQEGGSKWDGTQYKYQVAAWYDPVNDRVVIEDISPQGGQIYITGRIASTGGGKLVAADGSAEIKINSGNRDVLVGNIDTGNVSGLIKITDTSPGLLKGVDGAIARVTEITNGNNVSYFITAANEEMGRQEGAASGYSPLKGQLYGWTKGYGQVTVTTYNHEQKFTVWNAFDYGDPKDWDSVNTETKENTALASGSTIWESTRDIQAGDSNFAAWTTTLSSQKSESETRHWTTYNSWTHFSGVHHAQKEVVESNTKLYSYTVKADHDVKTSFLTGQNNIEITSGKSILLGGVLNAANGSVTLNAENDILNQSNTASIKGAENLTLKAVRGSIGTESSALRWVSSSPTGDKVNLNVSAGHSVYLDASHLNQGAKVKAIVDAAESVSAKFRGNVEFDTLGGKYLNISSQEGGVHIDSLIQKESLDLTQRLDITAQADVSINSENRDIYLGKIETQGDVKVHSLGGSIFDALDRNELDERSAEKRIDSWIEAGILNIDGASNGTQRFEEDVADIESGIRADFVRYQAFLEHENARNGNSSSVRELSAEENSEFAKLKDRFSSYTSADAAVQGERTREGSVLKAAVDSKSNYGWTKEELLFAVSDSILNPDPSYVPDAGEANIKASSITLEVDGSVGRVLDGYTADIKDLDASTAEGLKLYKLLARADANDVSWNKDAGTFTVNLKRSLQINQISESGGLEIQTNGDAFIQSVSDKTLHLKGVNSSQGDVRISANNGIMSSPYAITAKNLILRAGLGGIGSSDDFMQLRISGNAVLSGNGGIFVQQDGDLNLQSVAGGGEVNLKAKNIYAVKDASGTPGRIQGTRFVFDTAGNVGQSDAALILDSKEDYQVVLNNPNEVHIEGYQTSGMTVESQSDPIQTRGDFIISSKGDIKVSSVKSEAGGVKLTSEGALNVVGASAKNAVALEGKIISIQKDATSTDGDVFLTASESLTVSNDAILSAINGKLNISSPIQNLGKRLMIEAKGLVFESEKDVVFEETTLNAGSEGLSLKSTGGSIVFNKGQLTSGADLILTAAKAVNVRADNLSASGELQVTADAGNVILKSVSEGQTGGLWVKSADSADLSNISVAAQKEISITAKGSVSIENGKLETNESSNILISSEEGGITLAELQALKGKDLKLTAKNLIKAQATELTLKGGLNASSSNGNISVQAETSGTANGLNVQAQEGAVSLTGINVASATDLIVAAKKDIFVQSDKMTASSTSDLSIISEEGAVKLDLDTKALVAKTMTIKSASSLDLSSYSLEAQNNLALQGSSVNIDGASLTTATVGEISIEAAAGDVISNGSTVINSSGDLAVTGQHINLSQAKVNFSADGTLLLKAESSDDDALKVFQSLDNAFIGHSIVIESAGGLIFASDGPLSITARFGDVVVKGKELPFKSGSSVSAAGDIVLHAHDTLVFEDIFTAKGKSVSITGGKERFALGSGVSLASTDGGIEVLADGDASLGGRIKVNAQTKFSSEGALAPITIGAKGVMSVVEDQFEVVAENGQVNVYGGKGLNIRNDLTIVSAADSLISSQEGSISIGNKATVKAGTQSGLAAGQYGKIDISAGDSLSIGEDAAILSDDLLVNAAKDVRFGENATLVGATDGVLVKSTEGSIYMGRNLQVKSNAEETKFYAGKDIVIGKESHLHSEHNSVIFQAGNDIAFDDDFTVYGKGFSLFAEGSLRVGNDASVKTEFAWNGGSDIAKLPDTGIIVKGDIFFGENAKFNTTVLALAAGDYETGANGNIYFGNNALITTTVLGALVEATGDITFGSNAVIYTGIDQPDSLVRILAEGKIHFGEESSVVSGSSLDIYGQEGISLDRKAFLVSNSHGSEKNHTALISTKGDITLAQGAIVEGWTAYLRTGDEEGNGGGAICLGHDSIVDGDDNVVITASKDILLEGDFVSTSLKETIFESASGNIELKEDSEVVSYGDLFISAGKSVSIGGNCVVVTSRNDPDADRMGDFNVSIKAGDDIKIGESVFIGTESDFTVEAEKGSVLLGKSSVLGVLGSEDDARISTFTVSAGRDIVQDQGSLIFATESASLHAGHNYELGDQAVLAGDAVIKISAGNDILMKKESEVLGFGQDRAGTLQLTAGASVRQDESSKGITAESLKLSAGDSVSLISQKENHSREDGNQVERVELTANNNIDAVFNTKALTLKIKTQTGNALTGSLRVENYGGSASLDQVLSVKGSAEIVADKVVLGSLNSGKDMIIDSCGTMKVESLSAGGNVLVIQRGTNTEDDIWIENLFAGGSLTMLNTGGATEVGKSVSHDTSMLFYRANGQAPSTENFISHTGKVGTFGLASEILSIIDRFGRGRPIFTGSNLFFYERSSRDAVYKFGEDTHSKSSRLFGLNYRIEDVDGKTGLAKEALVLINNGWNLQEEEEDEGVDTSE